MDDFHTVILVLLHLYVQNLDEVGQFEEIKQLETPFFRFMIRFFFLFEEDSTISRS